MEHVVDTAQIFMNQSFATPLTLLTFLSEQAAKLGVATDTASVLASLLKREEEGSTALMEGVAIPHAYTDAVVHPAIFVVRIPEGMSSWSTLDGTPVDTVVALFIPGGAAPEESRTLLSPIAVELLDADFRARLKAAATPMEVARVVASCL